jgi:GcrA cell cycle regulator
MQSTDWAPEHSDMLRECLARGISFSRAAAAINAKFGTAYTRSAALGRGRRLGLAGSDRPDNWQKPSSRTNTKRRRKRGQRRAPDLIWPMPPPQRAKTVKLRSVPIEPRYLALVDLEPGDCRYPYGGDADGEAITFCGHPQSENSSYCTAHFHLTRSPDTRPERTAGPASLGLVETVE